MRHLALVSLSALLLNSPAAATPPGPSWLAPVLRPPVVAPPRAPVTVDPVPRPIRSPLVREVIDLVRRDHPAGARVDPLRDYHSVEEVLQALGDPWTRFIARVAPQGLAAPYDAITDRMDLSSGEIIDQDEEAATYGPLGLSLGFHDGTDPVVMGLVATGPAWLAGLRPGDRIVAVHGVPTALQSPSRLYYQLMHRPAEQVQVEIEREGRRRIYELQSQLPLIPPVRVRALDDGFAYARVPLFTSETASELDSQLSALERRGGVRGMVLDLRGNPGGRLNLAVETAELFLGMGLLSRVLERDRAIPHYCVTRETPRTAMPLVVLVDEGTGGVAEIVAGGLRDNGRAWVVGARTAGKGTVYQSMELSDGSALHLTTGHACTPAGHLIEGHGIAPDFAVSLGGMTDGELYRFRMGWELGLPSDVGVVAMPLPVDVQLRTAIAVLKSGTTPARKVALPSDQELLEP